MHVHSTVVSLRSGLHNARIAHDQLTTFMHTVSNSYTDKLITNNTVFPYACMHCTILYYRLAIEAEGLDPRGVAHTVASVFGDMIHYHGFGKLHTDSTSAIIYKCVSVHALTSHHSSAWQNM
jgi:hypothetical protein